MNDKQMITLWGVSISLFVQKVKIALVEKQLALKVSGYAHIMMSD